MVILKHTIKKLEIRVACLVIKIDGFIKMLKLNTSSQLFNLIKEASTGNNKKKNWKEGDKLVLKVAFGVKRKDDSQLTIDDVVET